MTAPAIKRMTVPEFLAWAESREGTHHELVRGEIVAMAPERADHVEAKRRAANALEDVITRAGVACQAFVEGLAVAVDEETSYIPDALVNCGARVPPDAQIASNPVVVVEVLSPSTRGLDKTVKLADYLRVASIMHYLIVDLLRRHVVIYSRQPDGIVTVAIAREADIVLDPPGLSLAAASLFP